METMQRPAPTPDTIRREMSDRLRRIETRLTRFMEAQGFDTEVRRPVFNAGHLDIPTDATSLRDILAAVPPDWDGGVVVLHKGVVVALLSKQ